MDVPTRSNSSRNVRAIGAFFLGALSVVCVPGAVAVAHYTDVALLDAGWSVAPAAVLALLALWLARRARRRIERTIGRVGGARTARVARILGGRGLYVAAAGGIALGVYYLLDYLSA